ncbi:MAG TPA: UrcA family protein [Steroidobacteraceae bacterium]
MKKTLLLATLGVALASGVAAAADPTYTSEIVVQSPRVTTEYSPWLRTNVERFATTVRVGYSDLDLTDRSAVQVLQGRVKRAAQLGCQKLNHVIPVQDLVCLEDTLAATQPQVQAAVNAAMQAAAVSAKQDRSQS